MLFLILVLTQMNVSPSCKYLNKKIKVHFFKDLSMYSLIKYILYTAVSMEYINLDWENVFPDI